MTLIIKAPALLTSLGSCLAALRCLYGHRFRAPLLTADARETVDVGEQAALNRIGAMARTRRTRAS